MLKVFIFQNFLQSKIYNSEKKYPIIAETEAASLSQVFDYLTILRIINRLTSRL